MRLALLSPIFWSTPPTHYGPRERAVSLLCEGLVAHGVDVTLFARSDSVTRSKLVATGPVLPASLVDDETRVWETVQAALLGEQSEEFDVIHSHCDWLPLLSRHLLRTPVITTLYSPPSQSVVPFFRQNLGHNYYVATSSASRSPELPYLKTIHPGIDVAAIPFRASSDGYLAFCGCLHPDNGVTAALEMARRTGRQLCLVGPVADQQYFATQIEPYLASQDAVYLGELEARKCHEVLAGAAALLQPHRKTPTFSLSAIEAMAGGTPVVAFDAEVMREIVRHNETGFVVKDSEEAVACLAHIDTIDRHSCRQWVEEHFSVEHMVADYIDAYTQVLHSEKPHALHASPPWGRWEVLLDEPFYKVKRITVRPGKRLSYQKHFRREEHWTVVQGHALVTLDGRDFEVHAGTTVAIPYEVAHRISNPGAEDMVFIEVQCGSYFGEDDIIRLEDDYGRAGTV